MTRKLMTALLGVAVALLGFSIFGSGRRALLQWSTIGAAFAGCGVIWMVGGAAMIIGGLWAAASLGRHKLPLWTGAFGSLAAGASIVLGVLTYVVPCSGPS